ncbi:MAG: methyltransferase domain-containing protein, partial [Gammaproteobacteria bacterium]|nr:methyltransferase domain-containing protein [Gammaproteobacteria bacterium]
FYESLLGRQISTELHAMSVFDIHGSFDVIWAMESISHIDPAEDFIAFAHDHLNRGGKLIISDANKLNPLIFLNARRDAQKHGGVHGSIRNPQTGEMIPVAHERVFDVFSMKKLLWDNGFTIESFHYSAQLPYVPHCNVGYKNISIYLERLMNPIRPLRWLSGIYTVVASPI